LIKESYSKHRRVVFNGNGYSDEWVREAERRGLPNVISTPDALQVLIAGDTISLFENHKVLSKDEMESRYHIYLEKYSKQVNIEAGVMIDIARRSIFPAASKYGAELARNAEAMAAIHAVSAPQEKRAKRIAELCSELYEETAKLETTLDTAQSTEDPFTQAKLYNEKIRASMEAVRSKIDTLEKIVSKEIWPFPVYEDLLFRL
ncbi:MAG: glutamine synthetase type III, partial [Treponema sp.]|nr:glutamine synthetase type III [Treponema sp.]